MTNNSLLNSHLTDLIYNGGHVFMSLSSSKEDTQAMIKGSIPKHLNADDIKMVSRLKDAFKFISTDKGAVTPDTVAGINSIVIDGPSFHLEDTLGKKLRMIRANDETAMIKALRIMLMLDNDHYFVKSNQATAWLTANYCLLHYNENALINIPADLINRWHLLLDDYYQSNDFKDLSQWLEANCIIKG